jgi:hypothetical protein
MMPRGNVETVRQVLDRESWGDIRIDVRDVQSDERDKFAVDAIIHAKGMASDLELQSPCRYTIEFRDGKAIRVGFALTTPASRATDFTAEEEARR